MMHAPPPAASRGSEPHLNDHPDSDVARAWRWCIAATIRSLRESVRNGRPITRTNLKRLFQRRWTRAALRLSIDCDLHYRRQQGGCLIIAGLYSLELHLARERNFHRGVY